MRILDLYGLGSSTLLFLLVLSSACIGTNPESVVPKSQDLSSLNVSTVLDVPGNAPYYLQIYPIRDYFTSDRVTIGGITSIPDEESLRLMIYNDEVRNDQSLFINTNTTVHHPNSSEGIWNIEFDADTFPSGPYFVEAFRENDPSVRTSAQFRVRAPEKLWVNITPWNTIYMGARYRIYGETNLPVGDTVQVTINELFPSTQFQNGTPWVFEENATVLHDSVIKNFWSVTFVTTTPVHLGNYSIAVCSVNYPEVCTNDIFSVLSEVPRPSTSRLKSGID